MENYLLLLMIGMITISAITIKTVFFEKYFSPIPLYILFGFLLSYLNSSVIPFPEGTDEVMTLFGDIGLMVILFQAGFESHIQKLVQQINRAVFISLCEVTTSLAFMFVALYYLVGVSLTQSILYAIAFAATSIAVSITPWRNTNQLQKPLGQLLLDLAALDDMAAIVLLAIFLPVISSLALLANPAVEEHLLLVIFIAILKLAASIILCYIFAKFIEPKLSKFLSAHEIMPDPAVTFICIAIVFGAISGIIGLSIALGAFLTGLAFSKDSDAIRLLSTYRSLEIFFVPYFFISIGFSISLTAFASALSIFILIAGAFLGKFIGVGLPALMTKVSLPQSLILSCSMIPRAEVTLLILKYANHIKSIHISPTIYSACVVVVLATCMLPLILEHLLKIKIKETI